MFLKLNNLKTIRRIWDPVGYSAFIWCFLLFLVGANGELSANEGNNPIDEQAESYRQKAKELMHTNPDSAMYFLDLGLEMAIAENDSASLGGLYFDKGVLNLFISKNKTAMELLYKSLDIFKALDDKRQFYRTYTYIGLYSGLEFDEKIALLKEAVEYQTETADTSSLCNTLNNLGLVYYYMEDDNAAEETYNQSVDLARASGNNYYMFIAEHRLSMLYARQSDFEKALASIRQALILSNPNDLIGHQGIYVQMANYFHGLGQADSAIFYADKILKDGQSINPEITMHIYQIMSYVYKDDLGDYKTALSYREQYDSLKTFVMNEQSADKLAMLELEYKAELDEAEIMALNATVKKDRYLRNSIITTCIFILILTITIVIGLKQRAERVAANNKIKQQLLSAELHNSEMKRELLDTELKYTNKELTSIACNTVAYKEILQEVKCRITSIKEQKNIAPMRRMLTELNLMLIQMLNSVKYKEDFVEKSETLNTAFIHGVKAKFPNLSDGDINLLIMVLLKFDYKEIASIYNISDRSVITKRSRLRKKLDMPTEKSFDAFFVEQMGDLSLVR